MKINERTMKYSRYFGMFFGILSIILILIPMLTVPLVSKTGLWYALYQKGDTNLQKEIYVGFWGVCSYDFELKTHQVKDQTCTPISLAYSFKLFNYRFNENKSPDQDSALEVNATQTTVLLWYPFILILILIGMILSTSKHLKNLKRSSICYFMSSIITISVYSGTLMVFLGLKSQFLNTNPQTQDLIPLKYRTLSMAHLPLVSGCLLFVNSLIGLIRFLSVSSQETLEECQSRDEENQESKVGLGDDNSIHSIESNQSNFNENQFTDEKVRREEIHGNHHPPPPAYYPSKSN